MLLVAIVTGAKATDYVICNANKNSSTTSGSWVFTDGGKTWTMTCGTESYAKGSSDKADYLKMNRNKTWTVAIPEGLKVTKFKVQGWQNQSSGNYSTKISNVNGTDVDYALPLSNATEAEYTYTFTTAATGSFTFTISGDKQVLVKYTITAEAIPQGPTLSVAPTTAKDFTYVAGNGPSEAQAFTVTLANSEKAVSATLSSTNYEMSKTEDGTYANTAITDLANGSKVYVRLKAGLEKADDYNGTLTFANDDVTDDVVVDLSGSVTGQTYTVDYKLNGGSGDAPTQDPVEAGTQITLPAAASRDFYTFNGWLCDADNVVYDAETLYEMTAANTTFTAQWTDPSYSSTLDFAANSVEQPAIATLLASGNMISDVEGEWEPLTAGKEGYGGFKVKKNNASLKFLAKAGTHVTITLGSINHAVTLKKNGTTAGTISGGADYTGNTKMAIVAFDAGEEDVLVELVTSDNKTVTLIKIAIEDDLASTPVTVGETGFATIGLPYATTIPENVTAYSVSATSQTAVTLSSAIAAGTTIPANKGFIIVATPGDYTFNQFANDTWQGDVDNKLEATGASSKVAAAAGEFYYFAIIDSTHKKVGFKKCAANATLAANKAYLPGAGLNTNSLSLSFDGETAINGIAESEANAEAPVKVVKNGQLFIGNYNVAGARIK